MPAGFVNVPAVALVTSQARNEAGPTFHQRNYAIAGITRDAAGNPLAGCPVLLFNAATNVLAQSQVSDGGGNYSFAVDPTQQWFAVATGSGVQGVTAILVGA